MRKKASLTEELDAITRDYDYGIVPCSATVFVLDEINHLGRLDLTLLEGVMIIVEVNREGYKVTSCSALHNSILAMETSRNISFSLNVVYDSMETLLMSVSPLYCERLERFLLERIFNDPTLSASSSSPASTSDSIPPQQPHPQHNTTA
ncbi:hypothetical protein BCR43DRAFT_493458 [Syncephalastrum racemosum]|uniref:GSKIP domain-containing protein n=1 Tax=Syncephalastrum racemosum TaxID=13706 RepID=A0A1X2HBY1_SYNRA|nr:hypothetical protein BCR43DRAFT_493458 [Syncephalastrum racemosum]